VRHAACLYISIASCYLLLIAIMSSSRDERSGGRMVIMPDFWLIADDGYAHASGAPLRRPR
jgi:hypothetical protein